MSDAFGYDSPIGRLSIHTDRGEVLQIELPEEGREISRSAVAEPFSCRVLEAFEAYFADSRYVFDLPLARTGTRFQQRVWARLQLIPPGTTCNYGELARELDTSPRALGNACRANPCPILVPCHRVLSCRGLGGYAGATAGPRLEIKRRLLRHEGVL